MSNIYRRIIVFFKELYVDSFKHKFKFCLTNFAIDCCTFSLLIPTFLCKQIGRVSFWNHFDSVRFYLKIRLTKILHYEVFKVQRTFSHPAKQFVILSCAPSL